MSTRKLITDKNVIDFSQGADFYADLALSHIDKGEFLSALEYIGRAISQLPNLPEFWLIKGNIFQSMELFELSNRQFFHALTLDERLGEAYYAVSYNYFYLGDYDTAIYYLKLCSKCVGYGSEENGDLSAESVEEAFAFLAQESERVQTSGNRNFKELIELGRNVLRMGEYEEAIQIFSFVPQTSKYYISAQNYKAVCYYSMDEYQKCLTTLSGILENEPEDVFAHCTRISLFKQMKADGALPEGVSATRAINKSLRVLEELRDLSASELKKMLMIYCELEQHKKAAAIADQLYDIKPHEIQQRLFAAIACYNSGVPERAVLHAKYLCKLNNRDVVARYYATLFEKNAQLKANGQKIAPKTISYSNNLPFNEASRLLKKLQSMNYSNLVGKEREEFMDCAMWCIKHGDSPLKQLIIDLLCISGEYDSFLQEMMIDSTISHYCKKMLIKNMVLSKRSKKIYVLIYDYFKRLAPKYPKILGQMPMIYHEVFADVFASLAFGSVDFERKLRDYSQVFFSSCLKLIDKLKSPEAIAACMVYRGKLLDEKRLTQISAIFNAKRTLVTAYNKLLDEVEQL